MTTKLSFRLATPEDATRLALIYARAYANRDGERPLIITRETDIESFQCKMRRPSVWTIVAEARGGVVGFALGYPLLNEEKPNAPTDTEYLSQLAVDPISQGQGIASKLIDVVAKKAQSEKRNIITLWTNEAGNEHARAFYEHKRFRFTGEERESTHGHQIKYQLALCAYSKQPTFKPINKHKHFL